MESMQKYIEVLEENLELRNTLPFPVKRLVTENENLKAEIQTLQDAQEMVMENENLKAETQAIQDAQENIKIRSLKEMM